MLTVTALNPVIAAGSDVNPWFDGTEVRHMMEQRLPQGDVVVRQHQVVTHRTHKIASCSERWVMARTRVRRAGSVY